MTQTKKIAPYFYDGILKTNTSKSFLQRAMAISILAQGTTTLKRVGWAKDTEAVHQIIQQLGATTRIEGDLMIIQHDNLEKSITQNLSVGESGLALRMFSSIVTHFKTEIQVTGEGSLLQRPIDPIIETLVAAGATIESTDGGLPLKICGPLAGGDIEIDGSFSSQILTGLLITLPLIANDTTLVVKKPTSKPYIDMTLDIMSHFGIDISHDSHEQFNITGNQQYQGRTYAIEGDWSGAANHLVGAAISGEIKMTGLNPNSSQADRAILKALELYGAEIILSDDSVTIKKLNANPIEFDATHCPDLFPPLVALAGSCIGDSKLVGTDRLLHKESNRLETLISTFGKLGVGISQFPNGIIVHGTGNNTGGTLNSFNDHRIAMVAAICATYSTADIFIENAEAVSKSYPAFFEDLSSVSTIK